MPNQFTLNHVLVDVDRCMIVVENRETSIEPRAMDVLAYLAAHPKTVVTHEALFEALWPKTVFSAGAVQRCIAQVRKALGEDAKNAQFIVTHPKRGYSLDIEPNWQFERREKPPIKRLFPALATFLVCVFALATWLFFSGDKQHAFGGTLAPVTSNTAYDFNPLFSKDGKSVVFLRQSTEHTQIVKQQLSSSHEHVFLTTEENVQSISWSDDNRSLYTVVNDDEGDWLGQLDLKTGEWIRIHTVARPFDLWHVTDTKNTLYLVEASNRRNTPANSKVVQLNKKQRLVSDFLKSDEHFTPYRIALSPDHKTLAFAGESANSQVEIRTFDIGTKTLSEPLVSLELGFTEIAWHPTVDKLLVHHVNKLFELDLNGNRSEINYTGYQRVFNPSYSPDGKQIALTITNLDNDIVELTGDNTSVSVSRVINSNGEDHLARYSPSGNQIAYVSQRAGKAQIYVLNEGQNKLIFSNDSNLPIFRGPVWAKDGSQLAFYFGTDIFLYNLHSETLEQHQMPTSFSAVLDWYASGNALLIAVKENNSSYFARYELGNDKITLLSKKGVNFSARIDAQDRLIYQTDDAVYVDDNAISLQVFPVIDSLIIPVEQGWVFQSGRDIYYFAHGQAQRIHQELPVLADRLIDAVSLDKLLFQARPQDSANIVLIQ